MSAHTTEPVDEVGRPLPTGVAVASLSGAPGATTTALLATAAWPSRAVLVECDPSGGDIAPWWGIAMSPGLGTMAASIGHGRDAPDAWGHVQRLAGGVDVIAGVAGMSQAAAIEDLWPGLVRQMLDLGTDLVFDLGRCYLPPARAVAEICRVADLLIVVTRADLASASHLRASSEALRALRVDLAVVVVGESPHQAEEIAAVGGIDLLGVLPQDERAAAAVRGDLRRAAAFNRSRLCRASRELAVAASLRARSGDVPRLRAETIRGTASAGPSRGTSLEQAARRSVPGHAGGDPVLGTAGARALGARRGAPGALGASRSPEGGPRTP